MKETGLLQREQHEDDGVWDDGQQEHDEEEEAERLQIRIELTDLIALRGQEACRWCAVCDMCRVICACVRGCAYVDDNAKRRGDHGEEQQEAE